MKNEVIDLSKKRNENGIYVYDFLAECNNDDNILMRQVYLQAFKRIGKIVSDTEKSCPNKKTEVRNNIIPLLGGRGTGKTSALESITQFLHVNDKESVCLRNKYLFEQSECCLNPKFIVLDTIDADMIAPNESLFEKVLVQMYSKYQEHLESIAGKTLHNMDYEQRMLAGKFEKVYKSFCERKSTDKIGYSAIQKLSQASSRVNLRQDFFNLVDEFSRFMAGSSCSKSPAFMVVPIDDLDVNIQCAYELTEEIYQYLMSKRIIVFITMDLTQYSYICENHFSDIVPAKGMLIEESKTKDTQQYWKKYTSKVTQNYVDKILPAENRLHLPGIHNENRLVSLKNYEAINEGIFGEKQIKWVILYKLLRRTGIICDGIGKKKHYYEPDTIRKVVSLVDYLNQMEPVFPPDNSICDEENKQKQYFESGKSPFDLMHLKKDDSSIIPHVKNLLKINLEMIYKDVVERLENDKLQPERKEVFDEIRRQHRCRQHLLAFNLLKEELNDHLSKNDRPIFLGDFDYYNNSLNGRIKNLTYSYGNYQYMLNEYSKRVDKQMTHMIFALQTANMTSLYNDILIAKRMDDANKEKDLFIDLRQIIGDSMVGDWFTEILNNAYMDQFKNPCSLDVIIRDKYYLKPIPDLYKKNNIGKQYVESHNMKEDTQTIPSNAKPNFVLTISKAALGTDQGKLDRNLLISNLAELALILVPDAKIEFKARNSDDGKSLEITINLDSDKIDELGFVMWYFDNKNSLDRIKTSLEISAPTSLKKQFNIDTIQKNIENNCSDEIGAVLPFYSQDVYYNLLKRLKENKELYFFKQSYNELEKYKESINKYFNGVGYSKNGTQRFASENPPFDCCDINFIRFSIPYLKVLLRIAYLLEKQDDFYNKGDGDIDYQLISLAKTFRDCKFWNLLGLGENQEIEYYHIINLAFIGELLRFKYFPTETFHNPTDVESPDSFIDDLPIFDRT